MRLRARCAEMCQRPRIVSWSLPWTCLMGLQHFVWRQTRYLYQCQDMSAVRCPKRGTVLWNHISRILAWWVGLRTLTRTWLGAGHVSILMLVWWWLGEAPPVRGSPAWMWTGRVRMPEVPCFPTFDGSLIIAAPAFLGRKCTILWKVFGLWMLQTERLWVSRLVVVPM